MSQKKIENKFEEIKNTFFNALNVNLKNGTEITDFEILSGSKEIRLYLGNSIYNQDTLICQPRIIFTLNDNEAPSFRDNLQDLDFSENVPSTIERINGTLSLMSDLKNITDHVIKEEKVYKSLFKECQKLQKQQQQKRVKNSI